MVIVGLTGSIAMGKTTAAAMLRRLGVPVHDSDAAVHRLLAPGGAAVPAVRAAFPDTVDKNGAIDRGSLGACVFADPGAMTQLESIVHPMVTASSQAFLRRAGGRRERVAVLDIPLLFETGAEHRCDLVAVVSAPAFVQRQRVLRRGMTPERLAGILARQLPDAEKRRRADIVVPTGAGRGVTWRALAGLVEAAAARSGGAWPPRPYRWQYQGRRRHA
ncbi:MAG: dephospho-CoA kinase [Alphaproteobacteria bacterium]